MANLKGFIYVNNELIDFNGGSRIVLYLDANSVETNGSDKFDVGISQDGTFTISNFNPESNYIFFEGGTLNIPALFGPPTSQKLTIPVSGTGKSEEEKQNAKNKGYNQPLNVIPFIQGFPTDGSEIYIFDLEGPIQKQFDEVGIVAARPNILKLAMYNSDFKPLNIQNDLGGLDIAVRNKKLNQIALLSYNQYSLTGPPVGNDQDQLPKFINRIEIKENVITISYENGTSDEGNPYIFTFSPAFLGSSIYSPLTIQPAPISQQTQNYFNLTIDGKNTIIEEVPLVNVAADSPKSVSFYDNYVFEEEEIPTAKIAEVPPEVQEYELTPPQIRIQLGTIIRRLISRIKDFIIAGITRLLLEKLGVKPQILTFLIKKDFSNPAIIQLVRSLGIPLAIDPQILQDFFKGKIKLKDLPPSERTRILLVLLPLLPPICPPQPILRQIINTRNNILSALETINYYIQIISFTIVAISTGLRLTKQTILTIRAIRKTILLSAKALSNAVPPIQLPAPLDSALKDLTELADNLRFAPTGTPKLDKLEELIKATEPPLTLASSVIGQAVTLLNFVDFLLVKCSLENGIEENITPISEELIQAANRQQVASETLNGALYNGFIIEIEEVPFSPTVIRRKAVGINQSGIKLIETPLSFTTNPQFLIDELKFIIDRDNLKAY
jgi:hypothetical protein